MSRQRIQQTTAGSGGHALGTILVCLLGGLCIGSFWGMVDLVQALIKVGGGSYQASMLLILAFYAVTAVLVALCVALVGIIGGFAARKVVSFTLALLFWGYGVGVMAMLVNVYWLSSFRHVSTIVANVGFLVLFGLGFALSRRWLPRTSWSGAKVALAFVPLTVLIWGGLLGYSTAWSNTAGQPQASLAPVPASRDLPNILLLVVDSLRADHTSLHGYARQTTPHIDAIAQDSLVFERAYAQSSWTLPSVASILTSRYPSGHGATLKWKRLSSEAQTLPELLKQRDYTTAAFSANPFVSSGFGLDQGFDYFYQTQQPDLESFLPYVMAFKMYLNKIERRAPHAVKTARNALFELVGLGEEQLTNCQRDALLNRKLGAWLSKKRQRPFFAYVHYMCVHFPYEPPGEAKLDWHMKVIKKGLQISEADRRKMVSVYDKTIMYSDTLIHDVSEQLRQLHLRDHTLLVITADHGEEFYEHQGWGHGRTLYNELVHVPLVMRYPHLVRQHETITQPVMLVDLLPTFLALANIPALEGLRGRDLLAHDNGQGEREWAYTEVIGVRGEESDTHRHALIRGTEKFITTTTRGAVAREVFELYNLSQDLGEQTNIWGEQSAESQHMWRATLATFGQQEGGQSGEEQAVISEQMKKRLRALGYMQ